MKTNHPFFEHVVEDGELFRVALSQDFPVRFFRLKKSLSDGYPSVDSEMGFVGENNEIDWIHGAGETYDEAVTEALINFINLVVSPSGLSEDSFIWRDINA